MRDPAASRTAPERDWFGRLWDRALGWFFRLFNRGFDVASNRYAASVGWLVRRAFIALLVYRRA